MTCKESFSCSWIVLGFHLEEGDWLRRTKCNRFYFFLKYCQISVIKYRNGQRKVVWLAFGRAFSLKDVLHVRKKFALLCVNNDRFNLFYTREISWRMKLQSRFSLHQKFSLRKSLQSRYINNKKLIPISVYSQINWKLLSLDACSLKRFTRMLIWRCSRDILARGTSFRACSSSLHETLIQILRINLQWQLVPGPPWEYEKLPWPFTVIDIAHQGNLSKNPSTNSKVQRFSQTLPLVNKFKGHGSLNLLIKRRWPCY